MQRDDLIDLNAPMAAAQECSFTRAGARLGTSQCALGHTCVVSKRGARTKAGDKLPETLDPADERIAVKLETLADLRVRPAGTIRLTTSERALGTG